MAYAAGEVTMKGKEEGSVQKEVRDMNEKGEKQKWVLWGVCQNFKSNIVTLENSYGKKASDTLDSMLGRKEENRQQARI